MSEVLGEVMVGLSDMSMGQECLVKSEKINDIASAVIEYNGHIGEVIHHDLSFFRQYEYTDDMFDESTMIGYVQGIYAGYELIVACATHAAMLESGCRTVEEFLKDPELVDIYMPVQNVQEMRRVMHVRSASPLAPLDISHQGSITATADLAAKHLGTYLTEVPIFEGLIDDFVSAARTAAEPGMERAFEMGVELGMANAFEMYYQSAEERSLRIMECTNRLPRVPDVRFVRPWPEVY